MSEMVRRVATIIAESDDACSGACVPCVTAPPGSPDECQCMRTARAVIVELGKPTAEMYDAIDDVQGCECPPFWGLYARVMAAALAG